MWKWGQSVVHKDRIGNRSKWVIRSKNRKGERTFNVMNKTMHWW